MTNPKKCYALAGNSQSLDGGAMFGNAPKALWSRWIQPDEHNRIPLACRALLVIDNGRHILFETGIGCFFEPTLKERFGVVESTHVLLESLATLGLTENDIDVIVLSHLHFDHAGGLLAAWQANQAPRLLFPKARYLVGQEAWERALHPHARDKASFIAELPALLSDSGRLEVITGSISPTLGADYRFHVSHGHTPGMLISEIALPDGPLVFAADMIPGLPWVHIAITMGYDRAPEILIDEKKSLLTDLLQRHGRLFFTHDAAVAVAAVAQDDKGRFHGDEQTFAPHTQGAKLVAE